MITLTKSGNAIVFTFDDNDHYLNDGIIEVPVNSLTLVTDDSQMATFKRSSTNDIFISARYDELGMSKSELESWFKENAFDTGGVTEEWVEEYVSESISDKQDVSGMTAYTTNDAFSTHTGNTDIHVTASDKQNWNNKSDFSGDYNDLTNKPTIPTVPTNVSDFVNDAGYATSGYVDSSVSGKMDTSTFNTYSASTDNRLSEDEEVTAAALNSLNNNKQDKLTAGENITINGNVISAAGGNNVIELTQAQYNNLSDIDPDAFYIITDADGGVTTGQVQTMIDDSISGKADTSAVTEAVSSKMDTSTFNIYSASTDARISEDEEVTAAALNSLNDALDDKADTSAVTASITAAVSGKQDTLIAGSGITISGNVISAEGGGGKAIVAGRGIAITTGATADTVSFDLPISAGTGQDSLIVGYNITDSYWKPTANGKYSIAFGIKSVSNGEHAISIGYYNTASGNNSVAQGFHTTAQGGASHSEGWNSVAIGNYSHSEGNNCFSSGESSHSEGIFTNTSNKGEHSEGWYNVTNKNSDTFGDSGNTLFSVGNGTANNARHNALEIRQNGDIYCSDGTNDVKLQDTITATAANTTALGGLKLVQISQSDYDALATKDASTLYFITGSN